MHRRPARSAERIRNMLNSPGASIEMLTCGSAKGFMFEMTVLPEHSAFYNPGEERDPITSFIVKLAVTSQQNDEDLDDYVPINNGTPVEKSTESADSYFQEAKLQQDVWMKTVAGNRLPISPPIVSFSLFDNQNGRNFLTFLNYKVKKPKSIHTVNYLRTVLQNPANYGLGMIIMSKVLDSDTFGDFLDENTSFQGVQITDHVVDDVYAKLFSKIVRLFIEVGVIHFDLHLNNALIYLHRHNSLNAYIIDYGRASSVKDDTTNEYLGPSEKRPLQKKSEALHTQLLDLCHPSRRSTKISTNDKIKFISNVIETIRTLEHAKSQRLYGNPKTYSYGRYQFHWIEDLKTMTTQMVTRSTGTLQNERFNKIAVMAFDNLCTEITVDVNDRVEYSLKTLRQNCLNFEGRSHSDFQTHFLATWTEWAKSLFPRTVRKLTSFLGRGGKKGRERGRGRGRGRGGKTRKLYKIKRNKTK
jgi:hypothetical protein